MLRRADELNSVGCEKVYCFFQYPSDLTPQVVGDFQLMFVYNCIPLVGCGGPSGVESSTLSSYSSGIKKSVSQMYAKYSSSNNS